METRIDTTRGYIGDLFTLTLDIQYPEDFFIEYPDDVNEIGEFAVREVDADIQSVQSTIQYTLTIFDTGSYTIPPVNVAIQPPDTSEDPIVFASDSIEIRILSLVPADEQELKDIKPLMELPTSFPWLWAGFIALLLVIGILLWLVYRKRQTKSPPEMTPEERRQSAHERAYEKLDRIQSAEYPKHGAMKEHFSEISQTIRGYFEDRYFINALEMTTSEVMISLPSEKISDSIKRRVEHLLSISDLVKFAKYNASDSEAQQTLSDAYLIVDETKFVAYTYDENTKDEELLVEDKGDTP